MKKTYYKKLTIKLIIISLLVLLDISTKILFAKLFLNIDEPIYIIKNLLEIFYVENTGASFGFFADHTIILTLISFIFILVFFVYDFYNKDNSKRYIISFCLIMSGAIGNFIDRLFLGYVRDFIGFANWFVCNLADIFIFVGIILYLIHMIIDYTNEKRKLKIENKIE